MQGAEDGKHSQASRNQIPPEECRRQEIEQQQYRLARETIHKETAERPDTQCGYGIARQHQAYQLLIRTIGLAQIQRKQRREQHKSEVHQEIAAPHFEVITIPKFLFLLAHCC